MKNLIHIALAVISFTSFAQNDAPEKTEEVKKKPRCSKVYFDLSTGINNNGGLLGLGIDYHVSNDISVNAGIGPMSSWGYKFYLGGKAYLKPCHKGWALGFGGTYNTGINALSMRVETAQSKSELVELNCLPQANVFAAAYRHWRLGRNKNRIYLQLGWSLPVTSKKFEQISGNPITSESAAVVRFLSPGGPIIGLGFSFGG
jgi:hypothetical protein